MNNNSCGGLILGLIGCLFLCGVQANAAGVYTGKVQPISGPIGYCTMPPPVTPKDKEIRLSSKFHHIGCKEFRDIDANESYYALDEIIETEYIHLIAADGQDSVSNKIYLEAAANAYNTCNQTRAAVLRNSVALEQSACAGQPMPALSPD